MSKPKNDVTKNFCTMQSAEHLMHSCVNVNGVGAGVEYYEYECSNYCTPDGCIGHDTDLPIGVELDGIMLYLEGYEAGDYPYPLKEDNLHVKKVIDKLVKLWNNQDKEDNG